jgi:arylformamidase
VGAAFVTGSVPEQQPPRVKGPRVWLDMDQKELDDAYDQSVWAPNQAHVSKRRALWSESIRTRLKPDRIAYGPTEIEKVDIYKTTRWNAPIRVFLHGGAWRGGSAKDSAYAAEMFVTAGAHFIAVDFVSVDNAGGNLMTMADQVRRAVAWVYKNAAQFGGDPNRLYLSGHSSGAHLAGVVLVTDWQKDFGLPPDIVKGGVLMSGMYDLKAVRLSKRSRYVNFTDEIEQALSTQRHLDKLNTPIIVAHGTLESPEFQRQTREFAAAVKTAGKPVQLIVAEGYNHFELPETFGNPYGLLGCAALEQMKLTAIRD